MTRRHRPTLTTLLGALVLVLLGLSVALRIAGQTGSGLALAALPVAVLGQVIARRQPGNRIGLMLLGCSVVFALYGVATADSVWDYHVHGGRLPLGPAAVVIAELWTAPFLVLPLVILLFPDGRLPPRRRRVMWAYLADCALITGIFVAGGAWQVSRAPVVVDGHGQLVHNPGPNNVR